jgi:hypothetical protein
MPKAIPLFLLAMLIASRAQAAKSACPVFLVSGTGDRDGIAVTFRNLGKLPIRRLEFNCTPLRAQAHRVQGGQCSEQNASFVPRTQFTVNYPYSGGRPVALLVSLRSVMFSDGHTFKPSKRDPCRVLKIQPARGK